MFNIPGKNIVSLTDKAVSQISKLMLASNHKGLRIGVKKGGCAGMEYTMEYVDQIDANDAIVEQDGACVMVAPMAQMFLLGSVIDYEVSLLESGFKFKNILPSGGAGLRFLLFQEKDIYLRLDYGITGHGNNYYITLGEAF